MPMWRCPHCGTPQAESARCWVCRRSSTACATCRHFRRSVAAQLGYCGLDRRRLPLRGDEIRACWDGAGPLEAAAAGTPLPVVERTPVQRREFVPVEPAPAATNTRKRRARRAADVGVTDATDGLTAAPARPEGRWSLWGEPEA